MNEDHRDGCQCHGCVCSRYELEIHSLTNDIEHERQRVAELEQERDAALEQVWLLKKLAKSDEPGGVMAAGCATLTTVSPALLSMARLAMAIAALEAEIAELREAANALRGPVAVLLGMHPDDLGA